MAIEEEVSDYKIVVASKRKTQRIGVMNAQAAIRVSSRRLRTLAKQSKHRDTRVDRIGPQFRIMREQLRKKAAVSIAQDQCAPAVAQLWKVVSAAPFKRPAQSEVLEPAIRPGNEIEVRFASGC
jgi:predicted rRNA methylase YqxC with S4 and FtsJ domains